MRKDGHHSVNQGFLPHTTHHSLGLPAKFGIAPFGPFHNVDLLPRLPHQIEDHQTLTVGERIAEIPGIISLIEKSYKGSCDFTIVSDGIERTSCLEAELKFLKSVEDPEDLWIKHYPFGGE